MIDYYGTGLFLPFTTISPPQISLAHKRAKKGADDVNEAASADTSSNKLFILALVLFLITFGLFFAVLLLMR